MKKTGEGTPFTWTLPGRDARSKAQNGRLVFSTAAQKLNSINVLGASGKKGKEMTWPSGACRQYASDQIRDI